MSKSTRLTRDSVQTCVRLPFLAVLSVGLFYSARVGVHCLELHARTQAAIGRTFSVPVGIISKHVKCQTGWLALGAATGVQPCLLYPQGPK